MLSNLFKKEISLNVLVTQAVIFALIFPFVTEAPLAEADPAGGGTWNTPPPSPTANNVQEFINTGVSTQIKNGDLTVGTLSVSGDMYVQDSISIGTGNNTYAVELGGAAGFDGIRWPDINDGPDVQTTAASSEYSPTLKAYGSYYIPPSASAGYYSDVINLIVLKGAYLVGDASPAGGYVYKQNGNWYALLGTASGILGGPFLLNTAWTCNARNGSGPYYAYTLCGAIGTYGGRPTVYIATGSSISVINTLYLE